MPGVFIEEPGDISVLEPVDEPGRDHLGAQEHGESDHRLDRPFGRQGDGGDERDREPDGCEGRDEGQRRIEDRMADALRVHRVGVAVELDDFDAYHQRDEDGAVAGADDDASQEEDDEPHPQEMTPGVLVAVPEREKVAHDVLRWFF